MLTFVTVLSLFLATSAYPRGAPVGSCDLRLPGHGVEPQTTAAPFQLSAKNLSGNNYRVTIKSTDSLETFKGFLLAAIDPATKNYLGSFTNTTLSKTLSCPQGNAVTHVSKQGKTQIDLNWTAPSDFKGTIQFTATVVREYETFWVDIKTPVTIV